MRSAPIAAKPPLPAIGFVREVDQRLAVPGAADHRLGQPFAQVRIASGLPVEALPEAGHVLPQLPQTR